MRSNRETWRRRVERWARSGQTAAEFAAAGGFHPKTLRYWRYKLRRERAATPAVVTLPLVEVMSAPAGADLRFEIELAGGRRLRVPATFDGDALRRLLAILEDDDRRTR
jgi:transposase